MSRYIKIITAYLLIAFFVTQFLGLKDDYVKARIKAVNEIPHNAFDDLVASLEGKSNLEPRRVDEYLHYAQAVLEFSPQRADAWGLSGLCFLLREDYQRAIFSYVKASSIEPEFFGFQYNLAFAYFKNKQFEQAVEHIEKALLCDPKQSLVYVLSSSKIYALMLVSRINLGVTPEVQIKRGYEKAYQLMAASQYRLKMNMSFPGEDQITLEGF